MAKIGFLLLCHKDPASVIEQARTLTATGDFVAIHLDRRVPAADHAVIADAVRDMPNVHLVRRRVRCGWGDWSLVRATLNAMTEARMAFPRATHFYLISGDCRPIVSAAQAHEILDRDPVDHIECKDFFTSDWIQTGLQEERLTYRHLVNERRHPKLFYASLDLQQRLNLARAIPPDLDMRIGSQWFCLRRSTVEAILRFCDRRRDILRFFATTWIPDETFFQTLVAHLVPATEIRPRAPTFLAFTDYGMPATFHDDHRSFLTAQGYLFARKVSPEAHGLKADLHALWTSDHVREDGGEAGRRVVRFLAGQGRIGARTAPRIWETGATVGDGRSLLLIACKDYGRGKVLAAALRNHQIMPALDYVFDEEAAALPDMGGIERSLVKRHRHRRAVLRMVFDLIGTDRLALCVDPARLDVIRDLSGDRAAVRTLFLDTQSGASDLHSHAGRIGLLDSTTDDETTGRLLQAIGRDLEAERTRLIQADLPNFARIDPDTSRTDTADILADILDCDRATARHLAVDLTGG